MAFCLKTSVIVWSSRTIFKVTSNGSKTTGSNPIATPFVRLWKNFNRALAGISGDYYFGVEAAKGLAIRCVIVPSTLDYLTLASGGYPRANISISRAGLITVGLNSAAVVINSFGNLYITIYTP